MKCGACDAVLTAYEATLLSAKTGQHIDLCLPCIKPIEKELEIIDRPELLGKIGPDDDDELLEDVA